MDEIGSSIILFKKSMLQLCGMQLCSDHLQKDIIELEKIQKMVRICFHMMTDQGFFEPGKEMT